MQTRSLFLVTLCAALGLILITGTPGCAGGKIGRASCRERVYVLV